MPVQPLYIFRKEAPLQTCLSVTHSLTHSLSQSVTPPYSDVHQIYGKTNVCLSIRLLYVNLSLTLFLSLFVNYYAPKDSLSLFLCVQINEIYFSYQKSASRIYLNQQIESFIPSLALEHSLVNTVGPHYRSIPFQFNHSRVIRIKAANTNPPI